MTKIAESLRMKTHVVQVGSVAIGADNPVRIQSMTIADTLDTHAVVEEVLQLADAGCEIVRVTAPTIKHAENLKAIKEQLNRASVQVPLVADIHFAPNAAMIAAQYVEKVRINPGNFVDRKLFQFKEYNDASYEQEIEKIRNKFLPLVQLCKDRGVALRIGTNHGSLSDRIMSRYGDSPKGMLESALEFLRLCRDENYHQVVLSMKASNTLVMTQAYRLLVDEFKRLSWTYPLHLGVTEAGSDLDGRVKSAIGIGSLLLDGIGDTIRVSLTEDSIHEVPVARSLISICSSNLRPKLDETCFSNNQNYDYKRRSTSLAHAGDLAFGAQELARVELQVLARDLRTSFQQDQLRIAIKQLGKQDHQPEILTFLVESDEELDLIIDFKNRMASEAAFGAMSYGINIQDAIQFFPLVIPQFDLVKVCPDRKLNQNAVLIQAKELLSVASLWPAHVQWLLNDDLPPLPLAELCREEKFENFSFAVLSDLPDLISLADIKVPLALQVELDDFSEEFQLRSSAVLGSLFLGGWGDLVCVSLTKLSDAVSGLDLIYRILQGSRLRMTQAEFIACPSCGRTVFDLQETTQKVKAQTAHLKGVKIAVMGCVVNGPGEMADADFGYVGAGPGKIHLYVGQECIEKNIDSSDAVDKLIALIKENGKWQEAYEAESIISAHIA